MVDRDSLASLGDLNLEYYVKFLLIFFKEEIICKNYLLNSQNWPVKPNPQLHPRLPVGNWIHLPPFWHGQFVGTFMECVHDGSHGGHMHLKPCKVS